MLIAYLLCAGIICLCQQPIFHEIKYSLPYGFIL